MRRVVCAAVKLNETLVLGPRHFDKTMHRTIDLITYGASKETRQAWAQATQGFVDQHGVFMSRSEAYEVAVHANQCAPKVTSRILFSEDIY